MSKTAPTGKVLGIVLFLFVAAIAGAGYFSFSDSIKKDAVPTAAATSPADAKPAADAKDTAPALDMSKITPAQPDDIVIGKADAPVTIIDYSSLSCPHCAHFHKEVLPDVQKEFIDSGKAKLVFRHFPLNEPALRAAQLVNCADAKQRVAFLKMLFEKQTDWAFSDSFLKNLKPLAALGGVDGAAFDSCIADKASETHILDVRKLAAEAGNVNSTPSFIINGVALQGTPNISAFRDAIAKASTAK